MIMKMRNRSSYPDSPHPGHGRPSDWIAKPYSIIFTGVVFFTLIFGIAVFQGWRQFETTRRNALTADKTTANLLADLILEHNKANIGILQSYAHRPLFIAAVKNKDLARVYRHLSALKKNAEIDLTFVTDKRGLLWANFPLFPEAIGKNLSNRDWYKGISSHWKPYISTVSKLIVGDKPLAVSVCVPIFDEKERGIGILGSSQRLGFLVDTIERVPFSPYTTVNVIDRTGKLLYSNKFPYQESIADYRFFPILETAVKEKKQQIEMNDPQKDHQKSYLTVVPMGDIGWSVIIERSLRDIYRSEFGRFIEIGAISFLLFLLIIFFLIYLRKVSLFRKTEGLLQAETKLRQSEENFHHSLDDSPMGVRIVTEEGKTIYANRAILDIYGYDSREDLETTPVEKRYTPESHADFLIRREKRQQGVDVPSEYTINIIRKDGEVRHLLVLRREVLWDGERQFQVLYNDITDRKRAEMVLRESEERLRTIIEASLDAIIAVNVEGRLILFNGAAQELFQYSEEEALNQPADILLREEIGKIHQERLEKFLKRGVGQCGHIGRRMEKLFRRKDGSLFEAEVSMSGGRFNGLRLVVLAIHDITSRKKTEETLRESEIRYRELFDNISSGVAIYEVMNNGNDFIFKDFNRAGERLDGDRKEDIIGKSIYQVRQGIREYGLLEVFKRVWATGIPEHYAAKFYQDEQLQGWYENFVYRLPSGEIVAVYDDITERKRAEEELRTSRAQLRALAARLQQIREEERLMVAREIHDEMGGGLTGLKMDLSWLFGKMGGADTSEERVALMDRIQTANALIDQMIHIVRRISTDLRPFVLDDLGLIAALEWQLSEFTSRTEISHEFATTFKDVNMEEDTAIAVFRIFQEALTNVVRHARATKVAVVLREGERSLFGEESFVLEIRDNGRGITEEEILHPKSLGLLGMKERVLTFRGKLSISGEPGGGTALVLQIPRKQGDAS
ncbi:MAG: PAS domain S-box protein [Syntrophales bacterium]|jgi:PAS domain S-box-containing protein|nr:PAS domain S-box protein [Syntrophales bacterium]